ncbi:hypothetical protein IZ6_24270 [Terrihabitans soli]|uniref:Nitrate reductase n=1 Tax=Terrihabitans soli TaxID=708113 RepID=A0A6S6QWS1_9HYPH|nr:hypothetical protein [Terrihabitans soli]BCJ91692.1 hypothetical protein IZ6_24270 [Terrihabitans soli]
MGLFSLGRRREPRNAELSRRIAAEVRTLLELAEEDAVSISQIDCGDAACAGGAETIILVMRKGQRTKAAKIPKAMHLVEDGDIEAGLKVLR